MKIHFRHYKLHIFTLTFLLLFCWKGIKAQSYESIFGNTTTQWNIEIGNLDIEGVAEHKVVGDTSINGINYRIINGFDIDYFGFIREDNINGKAWYRSTGDTTERLIMDLSLNIGDSLYIGGNWNPLPGYYKVDSIYFVDGRKHLQFNFDLFFRDNEKFTLVEGITSNLGFRYQDDNYNLNFNPYLRCSYKNGVQIYGEGNCLAVSVHDNFLSDIRVKVFPNPSSNTIYVYFNADSKLTIDYKMMNTYGQTVLYSKSSLSEGVSNGIDVSVLSCGVYFLQLYDVKNPNHFVSEMISIQ
ncbi:MAG: T9SS type A sorting domain-containing protein [Chitinophagales bacterium]